MTAPASVDAPESTGLQPDPQSPQPPVIYYKVIKDGKSISGGLWDWSLPNGSEPGEWHRHPRNPLLCIEGFHLTQRPDCWFVPGATVYLAEYRGKIDGPRTDDDDHTKIAVEEARLIRELTHEELTSFGIYFEGEHTCDRPEGRPSFACGSSIVTACGSSYVTACDSSKVTACDSSNVTARDSSNVTACGSSYVTAYDSSNVTARGSSNVTACDSSNVTARDSSYVTACGSSYVTACDSSKVTACDSSNVTARDSSYVTARDSSYVTACGSSYVTAYDSSNVTARGSSNVTACDSSNVTACGSSYVTAYDSSNVTARDLVTVIKRCARAIVSLFEFAVEVDWTSNRAEFRRAEETTPEAEAKPFTL